MEIDPKNRFEILKEAYLEKMKEIAFWRERSIKVTMWLIGIFTTIAGFSIFLNTNYPIIIIPIFSLSLISTIYLHKNYRNYKDRILILLRIEEALGFFQDDYYIKGEKLFSDDMKNPKIKYSGTLFFILSIWIMAFSVGIAIIIK